MSMGRHPGRKDIVALRLVNLDEQTRQFMLDELQRDIADGTLYVSHRLSDRGQKDWPHLLQAAIEDGDDVSLADELRDEGRLNEFEPRRTGPARVPPTAPETLAEGEFNRFYIRGLCRRVLGSDIKSLVIYRAKAAQTPRAESQARVGKLVDAQMLLHDLRTHQGVDTALGVPSGPNSGLSAALP